AMRWTHEGSLDGHRHPCLLERRHQCFADSKLGDDLGDIELRVCGEGFGGRPYGLLVAWSISSQRVLQTVPELTKNFVGNIVRKLGTEVHTNTFRTYEADDLLHALSQRARSIIEK